MKALSIALTTLLLTSLAQAANPPIYGFLGTDLGWGNVSAIAPGEGDRTGLQTDLKAMLSKYYLREKLVWDLGMGWSYGKRTGENPARTYTKVITRGLFLESSVRYGKPRGWQIGPVLQYSFVGDIGLGSAALLESDAVKGLYAGLQVFYERPWRQYRMRLGGRWMMDLNVTGRVANVFQGSFEIGIPLQDKEPNIQPKLKGYQIVSKNRAAQKVKISLDARRVEFDYNEASLRDEADYRITEMGKFLAEHTNSWSKMRVEGHTDERGSVEYNQKLSEDRAKAVREALVQAGVAREKIDIHGYSETRPIDQGHDEFAWQRNRRVEFDFSGVQDMDLIIDGVDRTTNSNREDDF